MTLSATIKADIHAAASGLQSEVAKIIRWINAEGAAAVDKVRHALPGLEKHAATLHAAATSMVQHVETGAATIETEVVHAAGTTLADIEALITKGNADMRAEIQALVDKVQPLLDQVQAVVAAHNAEAQTITDLQAKLAAAQALAPEDVQALADAASKIVSATSGLSAVAAPVAPAAAAASTAAVAPPAPPAS